MLIRQCNSDPLEPHFNPLVTNGFSHIIHSLSFLGALGVFFSFLFLFSMKIILANRIAPDETPRFAESHLGLFCLPMSHKKDARLIWVNISKLRWFYEVPIIYAWSRSKENNQFYFSSENCHVFPRVELQYIALTF